MNVKLFANDIFCLYFINYQAIICPVRGIELLKIYLEIFSVNINCPSLTLKYSVITSMWWRELNAFFSSTTIHGFQYIDSSQSKCTRFIWTVFVLVALAAASVFLYQTFQDWETNYIRDSSYDSEHPLAPYPQKDQKLFKCSHLLS